MSRYHVTEITCPNCHQESDFLVWDSINTCLDPEMKEKVRTGEAFMWKCPACGYEARVDYTTLYHQMEDLVMIYYVPGELDKTETIELMHGRRKNKNGEYVEMDLIFDEKYKKRVVDTRNQFLEKLLILDENLDDRAIELMKIFIVAKLKDKKPNVVVEEILFDKSEDSTCLFSIHLGEDKWAYTDFSRDMYDYIVQEFETILEEEKDCVVIDSEWALEVINRKEFK